MITAAALKGTAVTLLTFVANRFLKLFGDSKYDSLSSLTRSTRVEPIALIDKALVHQPYLTDVMQVANATFTGYYLQGLAMYNTAVNGVKVMQVLDALNPNRDVANAASTMILDSIGHPSMLSFEAYRFGLPVPGEAIGLEAFGLEDAIQDKFRSPLLSPAERNAADAADRARAAEDGGTNLRSSENKTLSGLQEAVNLSVGRMFEVSLKQGESEFKVPVLVRTIATIVESSMLAHILGGGSRNNSLKERYYAWRAGQLEFIRDIVLMQDMIDEHKKNLAKDTSGVYTEIMRRRRSGSAAGWISGNPSVGTASNIIVMSKRTADQVERAENGRFANMQFRSRIFSNTYILFMIIIDEEYERVTIYHRDIALPSQLSIKELKSSSKGADPMEILKAYQLGTPARY